MIGGYEDRVREVTVDSTPRQELYWAFLHYGNKILDGAPLKKKKAYFTCGFGD